MKQTSREVLEKMGVYFPSMIEQNAQLGNARLLVLESAKNLHHKQKQYLADECYELYKNMNKRILSDDTMLTGTILTVCDSLQAISGVTFSGESFDEAVKSSIECIQTLLVKLFTCPQLSEVTA